MPPTQPILVFYHLFAVNRWAEIWAHHLTVLQESGLLDAAQAVYVGLIHETNEQLTHFQLSIREHPKIRLLYSRRLSEPALVWDDPPSIVHRIQLGESETILKMAAVARKLSDDHAFFFFHSKGVSNPPSGQRTQISHFRSLGLSPAATDEEINQFILLDMDRAIRDWRSHLHTLQNHDAWYYIWNFFWIRGTLLRRFELTRFLQAGRRLAPPRQRFGELSNRHAFAVFPVLLHHFEAGKQVDELSTYIDVKIPVLSESTRA